jgi:PTH1 family peptidyl-tRNA hydrolase
VSLFQKRPITSEPKQYYTVGLNKTVLLVGLGNPGKEYDNTRHNIGFVCIDSFATANDFPDWILKKDLKGQLTQETINDTRVILLKPTTFMNLSGEAVEATRHFYNIPESQVLVVHDELDIDYGIIRTRIGGSAAGHNGIKSIIKHLDENFGRVRIGIGPKTPEQIDSADFVLQKFTAKELEHVPELSREVTAILSEFVFSPGQLAVDTRNFLI